MKRRFWLRAAVASCGVLMASAGALAQGTPPRPEFVTHAFGAWTFEPILIGGEVRGFLAYADPVNLVGDNVPMVWYEKNTDGSWSTWGWASYELGVAVKWLRHAYDDPEVLFKSTHLCCVITEETALDEPKPMVGGLFEDDPMQELITTAEDPPAAMTLLEVIGWEAAPALSTLAVVSIDNCTQTGTVVAIEQMLNESANKMEVILTGVATTLVDCFSACTGCFASTGARTPASNGSWQFTHDESDSTGKTCFYQFPATQDWWQTGHNEFCTQCTGTGTYLTFIPGVTSVGANQACVAPTNPPQ